MLIEQSLELKRGSISRVRPLKLHPRPLQESRAVDLRRNNDGPRRNEKRGRLFRARRNNTRVKNITERMRRVSHSWQAEEVDQEVDSGSESTNTKEGESLEQDERAKIELKNHTHTDKSTSFVCTHIHGCRHSPASIFGPYCPYTSTPTAVKT